MPRPDVILHIGAPKAGSSSIQAFFSRNSQSLAEHGFYYPRHELGPNGISGGHSVFAEAVRDGNVKVAEDWFHEALRESARQGRTLLVSSEALYGKLSVFEHLFEAVGNLSVIGYFRHPVELVVSDYAQRVRRAGLTLSLPEFCEEVNERSKRHFYEGRPLLAWRNLCESGACRIRPFDEQIFAHSSLERDVLDLLGIAETRNFGLHERRVNASYSPSLLEFRRVLNEIEGVPYDARLDERLQIMSEQEYKPRFSAADLMGHPLYVEMNERYEPAVDRLRTILDCEEEYWVTSGTPETRLDLDSPEAVFDRLVAEAPALATHLAGLVAQGEPRSETSARLARYVCSVGARAERFVRRAISRLSGSS